VRVVDDLHVRAYTPLVAPRVLKEQLPLPPDANERVYAARETIKRIIRRDDPRLLVIVGPCSIHDPEAALEYARRLAEAGAALRDRLFIVMRTYLEKPRTTVGWRGLINDPHIDGSFDMGAGLRIARELLIRILALGVPTAAEMLDPISPQYIDDVVCFGALGARTVESQTHRALASGLSMPVGYKNTTDGSIQIAAQAYIAATHRHSFLGIDPNGACVVVTTTGNPDGAIILRGSRTGPNYDAASMAQAAALLREAGLPPAVIVDCSHANSRSDHTRQEGIWREVIDRHLATGDALVGLMAESNLFEGKQPIPDDLSQLRYGVSITDACVGWETTERMLEYAWRRVGGRVDGATP
jgi:3-deoxy-7-phosphoheptulonate synthase